MASAIASVYQNEGFEPESNRLQQFHNAAFDDAYEFIADMAVATVVPLSDAEGQHFSLPLMASSSTNSSSTALSSAAMRFRSRSAK
jgi:hypothetical protein